ncbi:MAG: diacylglycerol kinase family protein [Candidatus Sericytochromatia bacterium]
MKAMLIYNPTAGQIWQQFQPEMVKKYLEDQGWQVDVEPTQKMGGGADLARKAAQLNYDVVIAAGGDGTINEVAQGLVHTPVKLGFLPVGTTNVLAREFKIPLNYEAALAYLPQAESRLIDLGKLNQRHFLLMAGVGYDAEILMRVNKQFKNVAGKLAVFTSGVENLFHHNPFVLRLRFEDAQGKRRKLKRRVMQIFVSNASTYATDYKIAEQAVMDDGLLELHIFKSKRFRDTLYSLLSLLLRRHKEWVDFEHYSIRKLRILARKPAPIQIDGDLVGYTPATIEIVPQALHILAPKQSPASESDQAV